MIPMRNETILFFSALLVSIYCLQFRGSSCPQMFKRTFEGYMPTGNISAGTYVFMESITKLEDCVTKCCENRTCNAALMFNQECYALDCKSNENCLPVLHHNTSFRDNISMVLVKPESENDNWAKILEKRENDDWKHSCPRLYEFNYRGYLPRSNISAGNYSYIKEVTDLKTCTLECCNNDNCHVAIMHDHKCYNVECKSSRKCLPLLYHNSTVRKSLYMVLVKPVNRLEKWKNILENFDEKSDSDEELLPRISSSEETSSYPAITFPTIGRKTSGLTIRLPKIDNESNIAFSWQQLEGPTKLEFQQTNKSVFDIKNSIVGNYVIKLNIKNEGSSNSPKKHDSTDENPIRVEAVTPSTVIDKNVIGN